MKAILMVFLGGGLGSVCRYLAGRWLNQPNSLIPWGTFVVNITGSLIIGLVLGYAIQRSSMTSNTVVFLVAGFCGGFTTFSAFSFEGLQLLKSGQFGSFIIYTLGSIIIGLLFVWIGYSSIKWA
jgi:CrcB protein